MSLNNIVALTDGYKFSHWKQLPPKTTKMVSHGMPRHSKLFPEVTFFGLQYLIKAYFMGPNQDGRVVTNDMIDEAYHICRDYFGDADTFNYQGWKDLKRKHDGALPIKIRSVPEGTIMPVGNVCYTIENTDPCSAWLTNYLETIILNTTWSPSTVASQSRYMKKTWQEMLELSGTPAAVDWKVHCFGFRGVSSVETSASAGSGHVLNFRGSDTSSALLLIRKYYNKVGFIAGTIPAAEHSTITSWGKTHEGDAFLNMIEQYPNAHHYAFPIDSYDTIHAVTKLIGEKLKSKVLTHNGILVARPDSGDPKEILPEITKILFAKYGYTTNSKGYDVLHPKLAIIQGDGINYTTNKSILESYVKDNKMSADNIAFGSGGGLLQQINRDTMGWAIKCNKIIVDGMDRSVCKDPKTDKGKASKAGNLKLIIDNGQYVTVHDGNHVQYPQVHSWEEQQKCNIELPGYCDQLRTVFDTGKLLIDDNWDDIRARAQSK